MSVRDGGDGTDGADMDIERAFGKRRCQAGSAARMRVAEVGSGRKRSSTRAGNLQLVHFFAWPAGRTARRSQLIAGLA